MADPSRLHIKKISNNKITTYNLNFYGRKMFCIPIAETSSFKMQTKYQSCVQIRYNERYFTFPNRKRKAIKKKIWAIKLTTDHYYYDYCVIL